MSEPEVMKCAFCGAHACAAAPQSKAMPPFCPMPAQEAELKRVEDRYSSDPEMRRLAAEAARTEAAGYCRQTRVEEIMEFASWIGLRHNPRCCPRSNRKRVTGGGPYCRLKPWPLAVRP